MTERAFGGGAGGPGEAAPAATSAEQGTRQGLRFLPAGPIQIVQATDLGNVMVLKHEDLYLLTDQFGDIHPDSRGLGLYHDDTRILSLLALRVNGIRPAVLQASAGQNYRDRIQLTNPELLRNPGDKMDPSHLARQSLGISRERTLGGVALQERVRVVNYSEIPVEIELELEMAVDDADIFEVRGYPRPVRGEMEPIAVAEGRVTFGYRGTDGWLRRTYAAFSEAGEIVPVEDGQAGQAGQVLLSWRWTLAPAAERALEWRIWGREQAMSDQAALKTGLARGRLVRPDGRPAALVRADLGRPGTGRAEPDGPEQNRPEPTPADQVAIEGDGSQGRGAATDASRPVEIDESASRTGLERPVRTDGRELFPVSPVVTADEGRAAYGAWLAGTSAVSTDNEIFDLTLQRSINDLRLLVNAGPGPGERYLAAGVPWFTTLFGRDSIITALQMLAFRPQLAVETLAVLGSRQALEVDDWRDAQPGKILHELRHGEMAGAGEIPHSPYYGSADSTPLWLVLLGATFDWTGDRDLVDRHWPTALRALDWIDRYGDLDSDGFVEYLRLSERGLYNQGWKDSHDAIRDRQGRRVEPPIALVEVQGYVFDAKTRMARLARERGEDQLAERLEREAAELRKRFEAAFWVADQEYYAIALDGEKRAADSITSNPGHCLWSGIVSPDRARRVAERLLAPGLFSGWGVRTYASGQHGYNPIGYHTGTVWPHDVSIIAAGLKRYGFQDEANTLIGRIFEAAQHFASYRLPELFCGFDKDTSSTPVPYPVACSPQAWSAAAPFFFLQTMLGLQAHADRSELELVRPHLPEWLERVEIANLRVGEGSVDLVFRRSGPMTSAEVIRKVGDVSVTIRL